MNETSTQFSIYKIDREKVVDTFFRDQKQVGVSEILNALMNSILKIVHEKKNCEEYKEVKYKGFYGIVFKTIHEPDWKQILLQIIIRNEIKDSPPSEEFLFNANISYILFYIKNDCIYAMTGGYGSFYIIKFVERNYGLYLLPKILKKDSPVVKHITENNLTGNRTSTHRTNRANTSFLSEQDLSSIYKELNVEVDRSVALALGIQFDEGESIRKKVNLINKDSLVIRRSLSLSQLLNVISRLNSLEQSDDNFALNYLVLAKKKGYAKAELTDQLVDEFLHRNYNSFILVGEDFERYVLNVDTYRIIKPEGDIFIESTTPITLDDIFREFDRQKIRLTKALISTLLKSWKIETIDRHGNMDLYPQTIINVIQGFIEHNATKTPCYLINGDWYVFDEVYGKLLDKEYVELYKRKIRESVAIKRLFNLKKHAKNETEYNEALSDEENIIVSHTSLLYNNVELADAIFWTESTLYLMHNKGFFDGIGARDLLNQMLTAAECLQSHRMISGSSFLTEYYNSICKTKKVKKLPQASEEEFVRIFSTRKICFIAGYLDGYRQTSNSTYAKYLTIEADKKITDRGYEFLPMGIH